MDFSAPHVGFVIAAYVASAVVLAGLIAATVFRLRKLERRLSDFEARGAARRAPAVGMRP
jgi:heme exporter protein CcmD